MFRLVGFAIGCLTIVGTGYVFILQSSHTWSSRHALNDAPAQDEPINNTKSLHQTPDLKSVSSKTADVYQTSIARKAQTANSSDSTAAILHDRDQLKSRIAPTEKAKSALLDVHEQNNLIKKIQYQLNKSGCNNIEVTGAWDNRTQAALYKFIDNSNASLTVDVPDAALLSLIEYYQGKKCGLRCIGPSCPQTSKAEASSQSIDHISHSQPANRPGSHTIVSGWSTEVIANSNSYISSVAKQQANNNTAPEKPSQLQRLSNHGRIDTSSFGGTRMSLGVEPQFRSMGARSGSAETTNETPLSALTPDDQNAALSSRQKFLAARSQFESNQRANPKARERSQKLQRNRNRERTNWRAEVFSPD